MNRGKTIGIVLIAAVILYLIYIYYKKSQEPKCYTLEEVHEYTGSIAAHQGTTWVSLVKDNDAGEKLRPTKDAFQIGERFNISNTNFNLDGDYTIKSIWYDTDGNIGSLRIDTPPRYTFNYQYTQGEEPRDATYFGLGLICKI